MRSKEILRDLIAFPTISSESNRDLITYCLDILRRAGAAVQVIENEDGTKANLYATLGPLDQGGVLLSGHTDVVPVQGQDWQFPAFQMTEAEGRLYGRGACDMKGFVASALALAERAGGRDLQSPLHLALSYDEEIGCVGVRSLVDMLAQAPFRPRMCIVGEPTLLAVSTGHKGKTAARVTCTGREGHSALAPKALNAIYLATDMIDGIRKLQAEVEAEGKKDPDYDIPYTTLHVGLIEGGVALNIVPKTCQFLFEIRNLADDQAAALLARIEDRAKALTDSVKADFPEAKIEIEITNRYPALDTPAQAEVVAFVTSLTGGNSTQKVAFGTEGGLFSERLGVPTVVCGPGSMDQGHKPDEFVSLDQLNRCDAMLDALLDRLEAGL